ncbi:hypothetical protein KBA41_06400 [Candidatus Ozemobacteraceae bacterium]|nr:hypothetical protein [Candidatus Ozemobacteraceae bacterium]
MPDQAESLRELKRLLDTVSPEQLPGPEEFLTSLPSPTKFSAIAILVPDGAGARIPPLQKWLPALSKRRRPPTVWDQAATLSAATPLPDGSDRLPLMIHTDSAAGPLIVLPRQPSPIALQARPVPDRIRFLRQIQKLFASSTEIWITIPMSEFRAHLPLLHATDAVLVLVPRHPDAVLKSYEAVKSVHLSGYFSPISLAETPAGDELISDHAVERVRTVAKQFLSLDLPPFGVVLSGIIQSSPTSREGPFQKKPGIVPMYDFLRAFAERVLYPAPEDRR